MATSPPPVPKRLRIKQELCSWIAGVTPANGFSHDLSAADGVTRVFRGRIRFGEGDPLPCAAVIEPPKMDSDVIAAGSGRVVSEDYVLLIQAWAASQVNEVHPTDKADYLWADIKKRLGMLLGNDCSPQEAQSYHNLYGLVTDIRIEPGVVRPPDEFSSVAYAYGRIVLNFVERIDDPYSVT